MSEVKTSVALEGKIYVELTEGEARALEAIVGYGPEEFVQWFYRNLGKHYLKPHEEHTKSLFHTLRIGLDRELKRIDDARSVLKGTHTAIDKRYIKTNQK